MELFKEKQKTVFDALKNDFGYTNVMQTPKVDKVVVAVGTGRQSRMDRFWNDHVADTLKRITGQKPKATPARQSIAGFKVREGDVIGQKVTLRGKRAESFLNKLIHVALPRTKDFRGIKRTAVDPMGNLTIGIKEHTIFPVVSEEELNKVFPMAITIVTTADNKKEAATYLEYLGIPFKKADED